jgi:hypothetical protein
MATRLKQQLAGIATAGVLLVAPGMCAAGVLAEQALGPTLAGGNNSFTIGTGATAVVGAENFTLAAPSLVERIIFDAYHRVTPTEAPAPDSISWSIRDSAGTKPGSTVYASSPSDSFTTSEVVPVGGDPDKPEFSILDYIIDITDVLLNPGDYWVTFHVNQSSPCDPSNSTGVCDPEWAIAFESSDSFGARSTDGGASWSSGAGDFVFRIEGTVVPAPATVTLLGLGLALLGARRRVAAS